MAPTGCALAFAGSGLGAMTKFIRPHALTPIGSWMLPPMPHDGPQLFEMIQCGSWVRDVRSAPTILHTGTEDDDNQQENEDDRRSEWEGAVGSTHASLC